MASFVAFRANIKLGFSCIYTCVYECTVLPCIQCTNVYVYTRARIFSRGSSLVQHQKRKRDVEARAFVLNEYTEQCGVVSQKYVYVCMCSVVIWFGYVV